MRARIAQAIDAQVTEAELPADLDARITAAVEAEQAYVKSLNVTEARLVGFGASTTHTETFTPYRSAAWGIDITKEA